MEATQCGAQQSFVWTIYDNYPCSFILNSHSPQYSIPIVWCWWTSMDSVSDSCHIISHFVFSFSPESILLSLPPCCQPFHLLHLHLCDAHSALPICFFFFSWHLSFIFDPFPSMGHWSFWLQPYSLLSSLLHSLIPLVYLASPSSDFFGLIFVKEYGICVFTFFQSVFPFPLPII